jgi:hypothetical protein
MTQINLKLDVIKTTLGEAAIKAAEPLVWTESLGKRYGLWAEVPAWFCFGWLINLCQRVSGRIRTTKELCEDVTYRTIQVTHLTGRKFKSDDDEAADCCLVLEERISAASNVLRALMDANHELNNPSIETNEITPGKPIEGMQTRKTAEEVTLETPDEIEIKIGKRELPRVRKELRNLCWQVLALSPEQGVQEKNPKVWEEIKQIVQKANPRIKEMLETAWRGEAVSALDSPRPVELVTERMTETARAVYTRKWRQETRGIVSINTNRLSGLGLAVQEVYRKKVYKELGSSFIKEEQRKKSTPEAAAGEAGLISESDSVLSATEEVLPPPEGQEKIFYLHSNQTIKRTPLRGSSEAYTPLQETNIPRTTESEASLGEIFTNRFRTETRCENRGPNLHSSSYQPSADLQFQRHDLRSTSYGSNSHKPKKHRFHGQSRQVAASYVP